MKLYCQCGNVFQVTRITHQAEPSNKCPLCGREASTEKPKAERNGAEGGREVRAYTGGYSFRTSDGMGGKIPARRYS